MSCRLLTVTIVVVFCAVLSLPVTGYTPGRIAIVNTAFTVKAGDAKYWGFGVGSNGGNVLGRFRAEGGGGNDIKCFSRSSFHTAEINAADSQLSTRLNGLQRPLVSQVLPKLDP